MAKREPDRLASAVSLLEDAAGLNFTLTARARRIFLDAGTPPEVMQVLGLDDESLRADGQRLRDDRAGVVYTPKPVRWEGF